MSRSCWKVFNQVRRQVRETHLKLRRTLQEIVTEERETEARGRIRKIEEGKETPRSQKVEEIMKEFEVKV